MRPETLDEWKAYIDQLAGDQLRNKTIQANRQPFVDTLLEEGLSMSDIEQVFVFLVGQMKAVGMKIPEGGAFDLIEIADMKCSDILPLSEEAIERLESHQMVDLPDHIDKFTEDADLAMDWGPEMPQ